MNKVNYNQLMEKEIEGFAGRRLRLLLHSCCGPCSSAVIERLLQFFEISVYYYNPNIYPKEEFIRRADTQKQLIELMTVSGKLARESVSLIVPDYNAEEFYNIAKGLEKEPEGGARCRECFILRMGESARYAKKNGFDYFTSTLSISPHKNADVLNEVGEQLAAEYGVKYLYADFKKKNGYKRSTELAKEYGLYRQEYCGCIFAMQ